MVNTNAFHNDFNTCNFLENHLKVGDFCGNSENQGTILFFSQPGANKEPLNRRRNAPGTLQLNVTMFYLFKCYSPGGLE